jgi:hypothetical protein
MLNQFANNTQAHIKNYHSSNRCYINEIVSQKRSFYLTVVVTFLGFFIRFTCDVGTTTDFCC